MGRKRDERRKAETRTPAEKRAKLTVIVPSYNEEGNIAECLGSVAWADEILVVDSFSTDRTVEIAKKYADRVIQHEYINSAAQKNWAIPKARHEWVMILDCDERVTPKLRDEMIALLAGAPDREGYLIRRNNALFGKRVRFSGWGGESLLRLFLRDRGRYEEKRVHAEVELKNTGKLAGALEHNTVSSLSQWVLKINRYSTWKAEDKYQRRTAAPVLHVIIRPPLRFFKDFILRLGFLDGWRGFLIAAMSSFAELVMAAKLLELTMKRLPSEREKK